MAVSLPDAYGPGRAQDFLVTSSAALLLARRLLFPGRSFLHRSFSSALPYLVDGRAVVTVPRPQLARWPGPAGPWPTCRRPRRPASWSTSCGWPGH